MIPELNGDFLQWLRGFYYVATTGSVRAAAKMMNRNPSTISYQLKALEEELGTLLFDRSKKSLSITNSGKDLLSWTISTFSTLQEMRSKVGNTPGGEIHGAIRIAATLPILAFAGNSIGAFVRRHSHIKLEIERGLSHDVREAVEDARVDFGLLPVINEPVAETFEVFMEARPLLIVPRNNPWKLSATPTLEEMRKLPYVSFMKMGGMDEFGMYMENMGFGNFYQDNSVIKVNNYHLILRFVWQGLGAAVMDELCFRATQFGAEWESLEALSLEGILPSRKYGLLTRSKRRFGLQVIVCMNHLRDFFSSLAEDGSSIAWAKARQAENTDYSN